MASPPSTDSFLFSFKGDKDPSRLPPEKAYEVVRFEDNAFVTKIQWCKRHKDPQHEFLVCHVKERNSERKTVILVERHASSSAGEKVDPADVNGTDEATEQHGYEPESGQDAAAEPASTASRAEKRSKGRESWSPPSKGSLSSKGKSDDSVSFSPDGKDDFVKGCKGKHWLLKTLEITGEQFSVPQLIALVALANKSQPNYDLLLHQCYWFAEVVYMVVKGACQPGTAEEHLTGDSERAGVYRKVFYTVGTSSSGMDAIRKSFDKDWEVRKEKVAEERAKVLQQKQNMIDDAVRPVAEGKRLAEQRADKEAQRAGAAEQKVKELLERVRVLEQSPDVGNLSFASR